MASEENQVQDGPVGSGMFLTLAHLLCLIYLRWSLFLSSDLHVSIIQSDHTVSHNELFLNINYVLTLLSPRRIKGPRRRTSERISPRRIESHAWR